jgi:hypothetical protein
VVWRELVRLLYPTIESTTITYAYMGGFEDITSAEKYGITVDGENKEEVDTECSEKVVFNESISI